MNPMLKHLYVALSIIPVQECPLTDTELENLIADMHDYFHGKKGGRKADDKFIDTVDKAQQIAFEAGFYAAAALYQK